mmetsp:Transcript_4677/g.8961  ORF Transcript_4677/g.8961 Transcript_4677/m.8961 type:complete len:80 (+) Transcript_4677:1614-1853(+)
MCQIHFEGLVVPDPCTVNTSPSALTDAAIVEIKMVKAWDVFMTNKDGMEILIFMWCVCVCFYINGTMDLTCAAVIGHEA